MSKSYDDIMRLAQASKSIEALTKAAILAEPGLKSDDAFMAVIAGAASVLGDMIKPGTDADAFGAQVGRLFGHAVTKAASQSNNVARYREFSVEGVANRILDGIALGDREAEFALAMELIDREGKMTPHARAFWGEK